LIPLERARQRAETDARTNGCYLNPDHEFLQNLLEGLDANEKRYGYPSCPCRLATGKLELDRDIICPCFYRDPDVKEFGACYCALYVRRDVFEGRTKLQPVPEHRPAEKQERAYSLTGEAAPGKKRKAISKTFRKIKLKLWYCKQCGYVTFREDPPYICPICKAKREMFAELPTGNQATG